MLGSWTSIALTVCRGYLRSGPEERTIPLVPELRELARRGFNRIRYVAEIPDRRGPFHLCLPAHVLSREANRGVPEIHTVTEENVYGVLTFSKE